MARTVAAQPHRPETGHRDSLSPERSKDLEDVSGLIWTNELKPQFAAHLNSENQSRFLELVQKEKSRRA